jgi:hypothetical protein
MPTQTYRPLATVTLGSAVNSVTFSSIPATYRDLIFVISGTLVSGGSDTQLRVNGDSGSNYNRVYMFGNGSTTESGASSNQPQFLPWNASTTQSNAIGQLMDYSATDKHKTLLSRQDLTTVGVSAQAQRWANTAAITTLAFSVSGTNYAIGTTFSLYGVIA